MWLIFEYNCNAIAVLLFKSHYKENTIVKHELAFVLAEKRRHQNIPAPPLLTTLLRFFEFF